MTVTERGTLSQPVEIELPPTATYAARGCSWLPTWPSEGILVVSLRRTTNGKVQTDRYAVQERTSLEHGARAFVLLKLDGKRKGETYESQIRPAGNYCTCPGWQFRRRDCKHTDSLVALIASGV